MVLKKELSSEIVEKIKNLIFSGELGPGHQIRQEEFSARLGVSRTPLLHALQILKSEMLVETIPNRGVFVRKISLSELKDIFEYREAIEPIACRLASQRITQKQVRKLRDLFKPFLNNPERANIHEYHLADQEFHRLIVSFSGNTVFPRMMMLGNVLFASYQRGLIRPPMDTLKEHLKIIDELEAGEPFEAEQAARLHIHKGVELLSAAINEKKNILLYRG
jgi:DNA-binding GntR family transcriptional regulator